MKTIKLPGWGRKDWLEPGSCLAKTNRLEGQKCGGLDCLKKLTKQHKLLIVLYGNLAMKKQMETQQIADCHGETEVKLVKSLELFIMFYSLESLVNLNQRLEVVTTISVEVFLVVLCSICWFESADLPADPHVLRYAIEYAAGHF